MEVDPFPITEDYILKLTGLCRLGHVKELNLQSHDLRDLDTSLLERMPSLRKLDLSNNQLTTFPTNFILRKLKVLDVSHNELSTLTWASQFPNLEELHISRNKISQSHKLIVVEACPNLTTIDGHKTDSLRNLTKSITEKLQTQLDAVWSDDYSEVYFNGIDIKLVPKTITELIEKTTARLRPPGKSEANMAEVHNFLLKKIVESMVYNVQSGCYSPRKKQKLAPKIPTIKPVRVPRITTGTPNMKNVNTHKLPEVADYDPVHFVRCHFGDRLARREGYGNNDPKDEFTKVWQCAFEPDPQNPERDTGLVATCGGQTVNLIDCSTGKVIKRYRHEGEQFYAVAWTTIHISTQNGDRPSNFLAVGGYDVCLKLIDIEQFVCYKEWGSSKPNKAVARGGYYISDMTFHPRKKTWLFAGASDTTVTLWDVGVPKSPKYDQQVRKLMVFDCDTEILHLALSVHTRHLVAGCGNGMVAWNLPSDDFQTTKVVKKHDSIELDVPCHYTQVDGMTHLTDDLIACKCTGDGTIFVWSLSACLGNVKSKEVVEIVPLYKLQWTKTEEEYINITSGNGVLGCGDQVGNIWLYNLQSLLNSRKPSDIMYTQSRMLEWPDCDVGKENKWEEQMTDVLDKPSRLIVNDLSISKNGEFIVAVTDNNLVCVWKTSH